MKRSPEEERSHRQVAPSPLQILFPSLRDRPKRKTILEEHPGRAAQPRKAYMKTSPNDDPQHLNTGSLSKHCSPLWGLARRGDPSWKSSSEEESTTWRGAPERTAALEERTPASSSTARLFGASSEKANTQHWKSGPAEEEKTSKRESCT